MKVGQDQFTDVGCYLNFLQKNLRRLMFGNTEHWQVINGVDVLILEVPVVRVIEPWLTGNKEEEIWPVSLLVWTTDCLSVSRKGAIPSRVATGCIED